ncbi:MAG: glycosyltransferase [Chloroflexi bacterium]|nr:MAG: glycosyltransferase [Chloroflexota bacterium]
MEFSVVIATHNRKDKLRNCLTAVSQQTIPPIQIIVIDDASTDGTDKIVTTEFPHIIYHKLATRSGPAAARNQGIRLAQGDIVAFTDDDCQPPPDWLEQLAAGFARHPEVVGVSGYQEAPDHLLQTNPIARAEQIARYQRWGKAAHQAQTGGYEIPGFGTNNVAYKRQILLEMGGFDESFPVAAGEDADLKWRITEKGHQLLYLPLKVTHYRDYTWRAEWASSIRRGIGAYWFEVRRGHAPGFGRITLRLGKRLLSFVPDLFRWPWPVPFVRLLSRLGDVVGQYQMAFMLNKNNHIGNG